MSTFHSTLGTFHSQIDITNRMVTVPYRMGTLYIWNGNIISGINTFYGYDRAHLLTDKTLK